MTISREELLKPRKRRTKVITIPADIPEIAGQKIIVQALSPRERAAFEMSLLDKRTGNNDPKRVAEMRERLVCLTVVDEAGNRLLGKGDIEALKEIDVALVVKIAEAAADLSQFDSEDFDEVMGESEPTTSDDSA